MNRLSANQTIAVCWAATLAIAAIDRAYAPCGLFLALMLFVEPKRKRKP